jgi:8-oxo-dGTP pyrophosphatase MutT (NUDIX family)
VKTIDRFQYVRAGLRGLVSPVSLGVSAIASGPDGRVVLVKHTYRAGWYLPGGGVGRFEAPQRAIVRELEEEIGLTRGGAPALFGFYLRRNGRHCDYIAVYTLKDVATAFRPNTEIAELCFANPDAPPEGTSQGTLRRLAEYAGGLAPSEQW